MTYLYSGASSHIIRQDFPDPVSNQKRFQVGRDRWTLMWNNRNNKVYIIIYAVCLFCSNSAPHCWHIRKGEALRESCHFSSKFRVDCYAPLRNDGIQLGMRQLALKLVRNFLCFSTFLRVCKVDAGNVVNIPWKGSHHIQEAAVQMPKCLSNIDVYNDIDRSSLNRREGITWMRRVCSSLKVSDPTPLNFQHI